MMDFTIDKIEAGNYPQFEDMIFWRQNGFERAPSHGPVSKQILQELANPNLYLYALRVKERYAGWISLVYIPKVGKWNGQGHVYVDELWVAEEYRGKGYGKALMQKADDLKEELNARGIRLYVNVNNPSAQKLYERCGYHADGQAYFMEK